MLIALPPDLRFRYSRLHLRFLYSRRQWAQLVTGVLLIWISMRREPIRTRTGIGSAIVWRNQRLARAFCCSLGLAMLLFSLWRLGLLGTHEHNPAHSWTTFRKNT